MMWLVTCLIAGVLFGFIARTEFQTREMRNHLAPDCHRQNWVTIYYCPTPTARQP